MITGCSSVAACPSPPLTDAEWDLLKAEGEHAHPALLERTIQEEDHPDDYDGPCLCQTCMSYGE